jgi:hypothetical protein
VQGGQTFRHSHKPQAGATRIRSCSYTSAGKRKRVLEQAFAQRRRAFLLRLATNTIIPMSTSDSTSFSIVTDTPSPTPNDEDDIDSLPSTDSHSSLEDDDDAHYDSDAEREWRESLQQLELMLTIVVVPYIGKYFGRKCAYWGEFLRLHLLLDELGARTGH